MAKKKSKIESGFEFEIDPEALDDMEMVDALAEAQEGDALKISIVIKKLLGEDQRKKLYDHLRTDDGRVSVEACMDAIFEIIESLGDEGKN